MRPMQVTFDGTLGQIQHSRDFLNALISPVEQRDDVPLHFGQLLQASLQFHSVQHITAARSLSPDRLSDAAQKHRFSVGL